MKRAQLVLVVLVALVVSLGIGAPVLAAGAADSTGGISITPAIQTKILSPTDRRANVSVTVANNTNKSVNVAISVADFTSLNQSGGVAFLGSDPTRATTGHGLSGAMVPDAPKITILPNSSKEVTTTIANVGMLAPGGHYGAIIAKVVDTQTANGKNKLAIQQSVSSLVFLETAGQGTRTMNLISLPAQGLSFSMPSEVNLVFKATGNTQTIPRGVVTISHNEHVVQQGLINPDSSLILPGSTRLLQTPLSGDRHPWLAGTYVLRVQHRYDGSLGVTTYEQRFTYINVRGFFITIIALAVLAAFIVWLRRVWRARSSAL